MSYYLKVLSWAHITRDTEGLSRLSSPSCSACQSYVSAIQDMEESGAKITGGLRSFDGAEVRFVGAQAESLVTADVQIGPGTRLDSDESVPSTIPASRMRLTFGVTGTGGDRVISRIFRGDPR